MFLLHVRARREARGARQGRKKGAEAGAQAGLRAAAGWPAAGAITRLAHTRRAAASCLVVARRGAASSK